MAAGGVGPVPEATQGMPPRSLPDAAELARRVCGVQLPGGRFYVDATEAAEVRRLVGGAPEAAHPVFSCIGSLRTLGLSIGEMCALCDFDLADGPLLGEFEVEFEAPLRVGASYQASGVIESFERVETRKLGAVDRLAFSVTLAAEDGTPVARARYLWLLPRGGHAA